MTGAVCFGCGAWDQLQEVGDTVFCRACLGRMLRRVDERAESAGGGSAPRGIERSEPGGEGTDGAAGGRPPRPRAGRSPLAGTPTADAPCFLCGDPLEGQGFVELRGFAICARCSRSLLGEQPADDGSGDPPINGRAFRASAGDAAGLADRAGDDAAPAPGPAAAAPIWTPGSTTEWCSRCGRPMPGPGSYVLIDGRPHCTACAAARMRDGLRRGDPPAAVEVCDACDRALGAGPVAETEGFRLCAACLHSDRDLAVALARARHQRRLARASRRVLDGDDD